MCVIQLGVYGIEHFKQDWMVAVVFGVAGGAAGGIVMLVIGAMENLDKTPLKKYRLICGISHIFQKMLHKTPSPM